MIVITKVFSLDKRGGNTEVIESGFLFSVSSERRGGKQSTLLKKLCLDVYMLKDLTSILKSLG